MLQAIRCVVALAALLSLLPAAHAQLNPGELGSTDQATPATGGVFGIPNRPEDMGREPSPERNSFGDPIPAYPTPEEVYQGSMDEAGNGIYDPDSWVASILRRSGERQNSGFRPSPNQVITPSLFNSQRVARTISARQSPGGQGGGDWTDLARVLTQIFNGWDA